MAIVAVSLGAAIARIPISVDELSLPSAASANGNGNHKPALGALDVLVSGSIPPDPGEFVGTARLAEILGRIAQHCDAVLGEAPPLFHVGDATTLSAKGDAVLVVTRMDAGRRPMLGELKRRLDLMPAHKLGFYYYDARPYEHELEGSRS